MVCERQQDPVILGGGLPVGAGRLGRSQSREACTLPVAKLHARGDSGALGTTFALHSLHQGFRDTQVRLLHLDISTVSPLTLLGPGCWMKPTAQVFLDFIVSGPGASRPICRFVTSRSDAERSSGCKFSGKPTVTNRQRVANRFKNAAFSTAAESPENQLQVYADFLFTL